MSSLLLLVQRGYHLEVVHSLDDQTELIHENPMVKSTQQMCWFRSQSFIERLNSLRYLIGQGLPCSNYEVEVRILSRHDNPCSLLRHNAQLIHQGTETVIILAGIVININPHFGKILVFLLQDPETIWYDFIVWYSVVIEEAVLKVEHVSWQILLFVKARWLCCYGCLSALVWCG